MTWWEMILLAYGWTAIFVVPLAYGAHAVRRRGVNRSPTRPIAWLWLGGAGLGLWFMGWLMTLDPIFGTADEILGWRLLPVVPPVLTVATFVATSTRGSWRLALRASVQAWFWLSLMLVIAAAPKPP